MGQTTVGQMDMGQTTSTSTPVSPSVAAVDALNLLDGRQYVDPWETYQSLRDNAPCYRDETNALWGISRYADVVAIEKNATLYSSASGSRPHIQSGDSMINKDDPRHQTQRRLVAREFTPRAVKQLEDEIRSHVTYLIDKVAPQGYCEVVRDLAAPLPANIISAKLGFPPELWDGCREVSEITMHDAGQYPLDGSERPLDGPSTDAIIWFAQECLQIMEQRRDDPEDDLISTWVHAEVDGEPLSDDEIVHEALLVLDGGAETTRTVIGAMCYELIRYPEQRQILQSDLSILAETGVEEFIRWVSPILNMRRTATADHEFHSQQISQGDEILLMYGSANRDERVFDEPDVLDVRRQHNHHVAFGFGTHFCLGASLARLEIRVMFEELLQRLGDMRLAEGAAEPQIIPAVFTRSYDSIEVEFTAS